MAGTTAPPTGHAPTGHALTLVIERYAPPGESRSKQIAQLRRKLGK